MTDPDVDILIVDDDIELLGSLAELLTDFGYKVKACVDADCALDFARGVRRTVCQVRNGGYWRRSQKVHNQRLGRERAGAP